MPIERMPKRAAPLLLLLLLLQVLQLLQVQAYVAARAQALECQAARSNHATAQVSPNSALCLYSHRVSLQPCRRFTLM